MSAQGSAAADRTAAFVRITTLIRQSIVCEKYESVSQRVRNQVRVLPFVCVGDCESDGGMLPRARSAGLLVSLHTGRVNCRLQARKHTHTVAQFHTPGLVKTLTNLIQVFKANLNLTLALAP